MRIAIMQPTFNSWLGYYDLIDKSDLFVFYDDVQLAKRSWQVRNRILTPSGELYLTVPIKKNLHRDETLIKDAEINYSENWVNKHLRSLEFTYRKAMGFEEVYDTIKNIYERKYLTLGAFNFNMINAICLSIGINTNTIQSSSLNGIEGNKDARLVSICKEVGAVEYLSAQGSAEYIEESLPGGEFTKNQIGLYYHNYIHPTYNQQGNNEFVPYMGIFDLLFNVGFSQTLKVVREGRAEDYSYLMYRELIMKK